jgi:glutamyl-Q tRNA(Asp) synthetase
MPAPYVGRFAPSPTGPLHGGSLVAALASWLDARAHGGRWLVRMEDVDGPRCKPGAGQTILDQLARFGLVADAPPVWQSTRGGAYRQALDRLIAAGWAYGCACSRREIDGALQVVGAASGVDGERVYPGTCRLGTQGRPARATRVRCVPAPGTSTPPGEPAAAEFDPCIRWHDRRLGAQQQHLPTEVGDFVVHRADGLWAYQLAVVVDDAAQGITDVVRGEDLADNTARQIHLQQLLGLPRPRYLHTPLVRAEDGRKLSKQNGSTALALDEPLVELHRAGMTLGLPAITAGAVDVWLSTALAHWSRRHGLGAPMPTGN